MWWQKKPNGKWQFFERYTDDVTGLTPTVSVTLDRNTTASRKTAQELLQAKIEKKAQKAGQYDGMTIDDLLKLHLKRKGVRDSTLDRDKTMANRIRRTIGSKCLINRLTANYVKARLEAAGESNSRELITRLKAVLRWGYRNDYVYDIAWLDKIEMPKKNNEDLKDKYLEPEDLQALLDAMPLAEWRDLTEFLVLTGLRIGEAIDLKRKDVDSEYIYVNSTFKVHVGTSGPPKTDSSIRDVTILPELNRCLMRVRSRRVCSQSFFTGPNGKPVRYDTYRKYLRVKSEKVLKRRVTPHVLRHTYTSLMAAAGVPFDVIARQLGHEDSRVTRAIYFHVTKKLKEKDSEMIRQVRLLS